MIAISSFVLVLVLSMVVVRVATEALVLTGLSQESARFQARSAFSGSGFTTAESEKVVQHPVRRRIIMGLMMLGNAGIITAMSSLILSFVTAHREAGMTDSIWFRVLLIAFSLAALWAVSASKWIDSQLTRLITWALKRWTQLEVRDYAGLLHLARGFAVIELNVETGNWVAQRTLAEAHLDDEGILVLGIERSDGTYIGAPRGSMEVLPGDTLILYGPRNNLEDLDGRRTGHEGNWAHVRAVEEHLQIKAEEAELDRESAVESM